MFKIDGWMEVIDAEIISELIGFQNTKGYHGSLVEIGVHHGRSFFMMAIARAEGEKMLAIDTFEGSNRDVKFFDNCRMLGLKLTDDEIYKGESSAIDAKFIVSRVGQSKFFSIDGGHMFEDVENDLKIARDALTPEGIIVVDDFCNSLWPEVTFAVYDFLKNVTGEIVPFLISRGRLYCSMRKYAPIYQEYIGSRKIFQKCIRHEITIFGSDTLILKPRFVDRIKENITDLLKTLSLHR
jgi:hypothetical protein